MTSGPSVKQCRSQPAEGMPSSASTRAASSWAEWSSGSWLSRMCSSTGSPCSRATASWRLNAVSCTSAGSSLYGPKSRPISPTPTQRGLARSSSRQASAALSSRAAPYGCAPATMRTRSTSGGRSGYPAYSGGTSPCRAHSSRRSAARSTCSSIHERYAAAEERGAAPHPRGRPAPPADARPPALPGRWQQKGRAA